MNQTKTPAMSIRTIVKGTYAPKTANCNMFPDSGTKCYVSIEKRQMNSDMGDLGRCPRVVLLSHGGKMVVRLTTRRKRWVRLERQPVASASCVLG
jgi:hypothetical protein